jgi:hypothetical protein
VASTDEKDLMPTFEIDARTPMTFMVVVLEASAGQSISSELLLIGCCGLDTIASAALLRVLRASVKLGCCGKR